MGTTRLAAVIGTVVTPALLLVLSLTTGLGVTGWIAGLVAGWGTTALLVLGRIRGGQPAILPADWVTLSRALLTAGVAALVTDSFRGPVSIPVLVTLASVALVLDAVDGQVARRTGTVTKRGARFDGEVDAFLILVLSIEVARDYGGWVLIIGAVRYAFLVAGWAMPWLAAELPTRHWRRVVAAVQGIVLTVAVSGLLPRTVGMIVVAIALLLLVESFGHDIVWLYRAGAGLRTRRVVPWVFTGLGFVVLWAVLVAPDRLDQFTLAGFLRIPIEGVVLVGVGLLLPRRTRRVFAVVVGVALGLFTLIRVLDVGFYQELGRPFDIVYDWGSLGPAIGVVRDSIGTVGTIVAIVAAVAAMVLVVAIIVVCALRVSAVTARHRRASATGAFGLAAVWGLCIALGIQLAPDAPVASTGTVALVADQVRDANAAVIDQDAFETALQRPDPYADVPASKLLTALRGKDVLLVFVESYGQVAVQGTTFSDGVDAVLRSDTSQLTAAGYGSRSTFMTSSTFGGISWLAHSTLQSGLWVDNQPRYDQLVASNRLTLSAAFGEAGWRTVSDIPSDDVSWAPGTTFYHYDQLYDRRDVGYHGPTFSYASMPDQYSLAAFQRLELAPGHAPVMAEIDLVSSHTPWTPLPRMVPWDQLGDGSIFDSMPAQGLTPAKAWSNAETVRQLYGQSIQYSLTALTSWVTRLHDNNLVMIVLGDHQPATEVSGDNANHQVPIAIVAHDPAVLARIDSWNWQDGLLPTPTAPLWSMDEFRNRFFDAFNGP